MKKSYLYILSLLLLSWTSSLFADVNNENHYRFLQQISKDDLKGSTDGWQNIRYSGSQVGTTEFLIVSFSHGNPECSQERHVGKHATQGGGWSPAVVAGNDDKSVEIWIRHVTSGNKNDLGQMDTRGAGSVKAGVLVYEGIAEVTNTASVRQCNTSRIDIDSNGSGPYLIVAASDNGTSESDLALDHFAPGDDRVFIYLTNDRTFKDTTTGNLRGAIASMSLADAAPPEPDPNNAEFVSQNVPASMTPGETITVSVKMKNTGADTWSAANGHKLGTQNPQGNNVWTGGARVYLGSSTVARDQNHTFTFDITAPEIPGIYNFQWRMVDDAEPNQQWFGAITPNVAIDVGWPPVNLVQNGSFEDGGGNPDSWDTPAAYSRSSEQSADRGYSLKGTGSGSLGNAHQTITLTPNTDYNISVKINFLSGGTGNVVFDTSDKFDAAGQGQFVVKDPTNGWQTFSGSFNSGVETSVRIRAFTSSTFNGTFYVDDVKLEDPNNVIIPTITPAEEVAAIITSDGGLNGDISKNGLNDDYDGDGQSNMMELALGGNIVDGGAKATIPTAVKDGGNLDFSFRRERADLFYYVETCDDLVNWVVESTLPASDVAGDELLNIAIGGSRKFVRLRVSDISD